MFDRARLPLTHAYYEALPRGLESFAECMAVQDAFELLVREVPEIDALAEEGVLDPAFASALRASRELPWMPEVQFQLVATIFADLQGEEAYLDWSKESAKELYRRPLMRHLMRLLSPTLVVMGAASRWQTVRKGSTLRAGKVEKSAERTSTTTVLE